MPKDAKVDNDSATYLWYCRLGHICVKRMKKLHTDGLLEPLDYESLGTCGHDDQNAVLRNYGEQQICWKSYIHMYVVR